ncbi:MAG: hypothetical protein H0V35_03350, partial [Nitrospira sp.]|nr:hypothetical protein [Nitrospira sp.]
MTTTQLRALVSRYVEERLDEWEEAIYAPEHLKERALSTCPEEEGGSQWQDIHAAFSQATIEDCEQALRSNDLSMISDIVQEFITKHGLNTTKGSPHYQTLARELLKA